MCYRPIKVQQKDGSFIKAPCGHCLECLTQQRNAWINRMTEELKSHHGKAVFFTLTYRDETIPKNYLVYETSLTEEPKLYESESDYAYASVGFRGMQSYSEAPDKVLQRFYRDYTIEDCNIDTLNKNQKIQEIYEQVQKDIYDAWEDSCSTTSSFDTPTPDYCDGSEYSRGYDICSAYGEDFNHFNNSRVVSPEEIIGDNSPLPWEDGYAEWCRDNGVKQFFTYEDIERERIRREEEWRIAEKPKSPEGGSPEEWKANPEYWFPHRVSKVQVTLPEMGVENDEDTPERIVPLRVLAFNSVRKEDLQKWFKRARYRLAKINKNFSYFLTSEYGPRTLRPHYHGVLFGVNEDEVRFMFEDWKAHFGKVTFENVRNTDKHDKTAGLGYVAKYCTKGFYEHPLCSKDFFYMKRNVKTGDASLDTLLNKLEFTEYHSKHYERCVTYFGIDKPVVTPSFKLVSKGLGVAYVEKNKSYFLQGYEDIKLEKLNDEEYERRLQDFHEGLQRKFHYTNEKGFTFSMPIYYSKKILADTLQHSYSRFLRSQYDKVYYEKFRQLAAEFSPREVTEALLHLEEEERREKVHKLDKKLHSIERFYNKSKI